MDHLPSADGNAPIFYHWSEDKRLMSGHPRSTKGIVITSHEGTETHRQTDMVDTHTITLALTL